MGIFGRRKRKQAVDDHDFGREPYDTGTGAEADPEDTVDGDGRSEGPYDVSEAPEDGVPRMDLGSIRVPVPNGSQVQVEMDQGSGTVRAVHVVTPQGQVTVSAYAAPRSGGLWREVSGELAEQLRSDGARVALGRGEWGIELSAIVGEVALRFIGVDGPRWMLRGVIAGPQSEASRAPEVLRAIMRGTVVDRGEAPMPVRTPLQITLPEAIASHIKSRQAPAQQAQSQQ
ncbi:DUF3710 domain-containing protein [Saccharomonospora cyanea]|uniref:DUF3710 domain-containing protein n=1 Tax=Saccharomonospora cyanea NA-134 TaxID=882082 RepID=H5XMX1_9PSEU|nr:DUF3710 domain-containing protein [Saccharomonospora cyanea]EHR62096.1 Protein of unknown function (DUF3710) [Saccharomonospora cyanea NA-134]